MRRSVIDIPGPLSRYVFCIISNLPSSELDLERVEVLATRVAEVDDDLQEPVVEECAADAADFIACFERSRKVPELAAVAERRIGRLRDRGDSRGAIEHDFLRLVQEEAVDVFPQSELVGVLLSRARAGEKQREYAYEYESLCGAPAAWIMRR